MRPLRNSGLKIIKHRFSFLFRNAGLASLLFITILITGCSAAYKSLEPVDYKTGCVQQFKPTFTRALYNTQVNILKHHLSGLLLVKQMPDSSTRILFSMETGFKFFDFEFDKNKEFKVHYIIDKMNRKPVINTLRKDFELVLMMHLKNDSLQTFTKDSLTFHRFANNGLYDYYITDSNCTKLLRIEQATEKKKKTSIVMQDYKDGVPDTIGISHHNIKFDIGLKKLETIKTENAEAQDN